MKTIITIENGKVSVLVEDSSMDGEKKPVDIVMPKIKVNPSMLPGGATQMKQPTLMGLNRPFPTTNGRKWCGPEPSLPKVVGSNERAKFVVMIYRDSISLRKPAQKRLANLKELDGIQGATTKNTTVSRQILPQSRPKRRLITANTARHIPRTTRPTIQNKSHSFFPDTRKLLKSLNHGGQSQRIQENPQSNMPTATSQQVTLRILGIVKPAGDAATYALYTKACQMTGSYHRKESGDGRD